MIQLFCAFAGFINFLVCMGLAIFIIFRGPKRHNHLIFAIWSTSVGLWSLGYFIWPFTEVSSQALVWARVVSVGMVVTPAAFLHLLLSVLNLERPHRPALWIGYVLTTFFLGTIFFSPLFISAVEPQRWFGWWFVPGPFYHGYVVFLVLALLYGHVLLFHRAFTSSSKVIRKQFRIAALSTFLASLGGSTHFFIAYHIGIPPVLCFLMTLYVVFIAYVIQQKRFWDLDLMVRKAIVFFGTVGLFTIAFLSLTYASNVVVSKRVNVSPTLITIFVFVVGVLFYHSIERFLERVTDRLLFRKKFDHQKVLRDASHGMSKIKSLHHLLSLVVHFLTIRVRVKKAAVLMFDEREHSFTFCYPRGYEIGHRLHGGMMLDANDPLIDFMAKERSAIDLEQMRILRQTSKTSGRAKTKMLSRTYNFEVIQNRMEEMEARCCVPSFLGNNLQNVLVLGEKKSGDHYSEEELSLLYTLAQESAIAIENARLYDQAVEKARELETMNGQFSRAQNQLLGALSETEVANKKLRDTHAQLIHEQKMATLGRLASSVGHEVNNPLTILSMNVSRAILKFRRNPDLKVSDILDTFQKMEQNISRIKAVVNTLTGLLKKSEHGKFEPLSLKLVLEETLPLVQFQTYLENLSGTQVEFDVPGNLPLIKGDLERLQEVFLNLFINAYHAMVGETDRKITVIANPHPTRPGMVIIEFSDNGGGMSDEVMKKIFSYGFTTKPTGKGSGMGLYMCRYIIELHGGDIKVRTRLGEGTSFVITLPAYQEEVSHEFPGQPNV